MWPLDRSVPQWLSWLRGWLMPMPWNTPLWCLLQPLMLPHCSTLHLILAVPWASTSGTTASMPSSSMTIFPSRWVVNVWLISSWLWPVKTFLIYFLWSPNLCNLRVIAVLTVTKKIGNQRMLLVKVLLLKWTIIQNFCLAQKQNSWNKFYLNTCYLHEAVTPFFFSPLFFCINHEHCMFHHHVNKDPQQTWWSLAPKSLRFTVMPGPQCFCFLS